METHKNSNISKLINNNNALKKINSAKNYQSISRKPDSQDIPNYLKKFKKNDLNDNMSNPIENFSSTKILEQQMELLEDKLKSNQEIMPIVDQVMFLNKLLIQENANKHKKISKVDEKRSDKLLKLCESNTINLSCWLKLLYL